jgi:hypothetical protein
MIPRTAAFVAAFAMALAAADIALALTSGDLVGKWGLASYFEDKDAAATEASARAQCHAPYVIAPGRAGGVMLHLPDESKTSEMQIKSALGALYLGPAGEVGGKNDREVLRFDGRVLVLKWLDVSVARRYGTMVFARCGK